LHSVARRPFARIYCDIAGEGKIEALFNANGAKVDREQDWMCYSLHFFLCSLLAICSESIAPSSSFGESLP
jgi:hypothetical protein